MTPGHGHKVPSNIGGKGVVTSTLALQPGLNPVSQEILSPGNSVAATIFPRKFYRSILMQRRHFLYRKLLPL